MDQNERVNNMLVQLFDNMMKWESRELITGEFQDITNHDMHIIGVIGTGRPRNMSSIAKQLQVTVGTLTIAVNNLSRKGYVARTRGLKDKRVVWISLSEKGKKAYRRHEQFHRQMVDRLLGHLSEEETGTMIKALSALCDYMNDEIGRDSSLAVRDLAPGSGQLC